MTGVSGECLKTGGCYQKAQVQFTVANPMTVESATRDPINGYKGGGSVAPLRAVSDNLREQFPGGQKDVNVTITWSEEIVYTSFP